MDMGTSTTSGQMSMTSAAASTSSSAMAMGGMDMGPNACKISMTWNWYTVGACFISKTWRITSSGMFAGSCIGVICLVISLEFLRRVQRELDRRASGRYVPVSEGTASPPSEDEAAPVTGKQAAARLRMPLFGGVRVAQQQNRWTLVKKQIVRAMVHTLQFGVAYFVMLLAMYYNGYIIICILIGAFIGSFVFSWDQLVAGGASTKEAEVTGCCG